MNSPSPKLNSRARGYNGHEYASRIQRSFGLGFINPEPSGPIDPTPALLEMEQFRKHMPYRRVYVFESEMGYLFASPKSAVNALKTVEKIISDNKLALSASVCGKTITIKYIAGIAACKRINEAA